MATPYDEPPLDPAQIPPATFRSRGISRRSAPTPRRIVPNGPVTLLRFPDLYKELMLEEIWHSKMAGGAMNSYMDIIVDALKYRYSRIMDYRQISPAVEDSLFTSLVVNSDAKIPPPYVRPPDTEG